ncbi:MAG: gluconate 2-dehydrogenase subunit 3 family protein [Gammaproteobacteria bacterium]|nr:gluconate 2-dehydrogenase subunit 3 family protein [Gammaproteobacteria bacterium]MBL4728733.1 gluconate 2-dehydrogenase subunit 3 family protein [Gammaproteobacteria bacterium]
MRTRREVLQGLIVSIGGATALTACGGVANVLSTQPGMAPRFYTSIEYALITRISDLIIPRTETPGAVDVNVPGYLDGLMTEWANSETKNIHRTALAQIKAELDKRARGNFLDASDSVAEQSLAAFDAAAFAENADASGYKRVKGYVSQSYFATEIGATEELKWVAVPGRWDPRVEI